MKNGLILFLILIVSFSLKAQDDKDGLFVSLDYYIPTGDAAETYKPAVGFDVGYKAVGFRYIFSVSVGYFKIQPKQKKVYYQELDVWGNPVTKSITYEAYTAIPIYFSYAVKMNLTVNNAIYIGIDGGIVNYKYGGDSGNTASLSPKIGFSQSVGKSILTIEMRYNLLPFTGGNTWNTGVAFLF